MKLFIRLILFLFCFNAYADALQARLYTYASEYAGSVAVSRLTFEQAAELAVRNNSELNKTKEDRDTEAVKIDKAIGSLLPELRASAAKNTLDKSRPDYIEKAAQDNLNAKIKLKQILFSDSMLANKDTAEYKTSLNRLLAESMRLDILKETADKYYNLMMYENIAASLSKSLTRFESINTLMKKAKAPKSTMRTYDKYIKEIKAEIKNISEKRNTAKQSLEKMTGLSIKNNCEYETYQTMRGYASLSIFIELFTSADSEKSFEKLENFLTNKALEDSAELKAVDELLKLNKRDIKSEKRKYLLPDISVSGEYTQYLDKDEETSDYTADFNNNDWSVNLKLSMPIFDGKKSSPDLHAKNTERLQYLNKRAEVKEAVKKRMMNAVVSAKKSGETYQTAKTEYALSDAKFEKFRKLYEKRKLKSISVVNACRALNQAEKDMITAEYEMINALTDIQRAYGKFFAMSEHSEDKRFLFDLQKLMESN